MHLLGDDISVSNGAWGGKRYMSKRAMLGTMPSPSRNHGEEEGLEKILEKREEDHLPAELSVCPAIEGSAMLTNWSEPVGTTGRGGGR
jgi:hypothetical protein